MSSSSLSLDSLSSGILSIKLLGKGSLFELSLEIDSESLILIVFVIKIYRKQRDKRGEKRERKERREN